MFVLEEENLSVFLQGHPEYDADTLAREYVAMFGDLKIRLKIARKTAAFSAAALAKIGFSWNNYSRFSCPAKVIRDARLRVSRFPKGH